MADAATSAAVAAASASPQCPFLASASKGLTLGPPGLEQQMQRQADDALKPPAPASSAAPAVCPLGFGSSQQPRMGQFHCIICK